MLCGRFNVCNFAMVAVCGRPSGLPGAYNRFANLRTAATFLFSDSSGRLHSYSSFTMIKPTPNPPETDPTSPYESLDSKKLNDAAERALDHYLCPPGSTPPPRKTRRMYAVTADFKNEELLADASETLASARTIAHDFAHLIPASQRRTLLGIAQLIMLGELAVNRVMDNLDLPN